MYINQNTSNYANSVNHINNSVSKAVNNSDVAGYHNVRPNFNNDISVMNPQLQHSDLVVMDYPGVREYENQPPVDKNLVNEQDREEFIGQYDEAEDSQS